MPMRADDDEEGGEDPAVLCFMAEFIGARADYYMLIWQAYSSSPNGSYRAPLNWAAYLGGPFWKFRRGLAFDGWVQMFWILVCGGVGAYGGRQGVVVGFGIAWLVFGIGSLISGSVDYLITIHHRALLARGNRRPMPRRSDIAAAVQIALAAVLITTWLVSFE